MPANVGLFVLEAKKSADSVFERLGGQERLVELVDRLYDYMATDKDMKKFFANRNLPHLKKRTVDFLGGMWGGEAYRGPDLFLAHTGLGISVKTFDLMMKGLEVAFKKMSIDKNLAAIIRKDIGDMKEPLCDPSGRLAKAQSAKNLEGGDPFDDAANRAAYAENQRKEKERREKLAAFKKEKKRKEEAERLAKEKADKGKMDPKDKAKAKSKAKSKAKEGEAEAAAKETTATALLQLPKAEEVPDSAQTTMDTEGDGEFGGVVASATWSDVKTRLSSLAPGCQLTVSL
eukprot:TRINITY_DN47594_c0_g1_i1.p1 TRINITY_DN47594_c0_g1~~TRINITY_DN47594_c0_g1_i1.p1  ORF type:complete len:288 (+),score=98.31 TRINITY_DN47594_c0_g1_i1:60-923(+)